MYGRYFFMVTKSFPRKQICTRNLHQKFFNQSFMFGKTLTREQVPIQNSHHRFFIPPKIFITNSLVEHFFMVAISSSKTGSHQK